MLDCTIWYSLNKWLVEWTKPDCSQQLSSLFLPTTAREENVATFRGSEYFCYDLSQNPIQSSSDEITLSFKTWQRNGLILHTGKSADYVNLALKDGAVSLVINLGSGAFEAIVEPVNGKFNDNSWHDVKVTRNLRQVGLCVKNGMLWLVEWQSNYNMLASQKHSVSQPQQPAKLAGLQNFSYSNISFSC